MRPVQDGGWSERLPPGSLPGDSTPAEPFQLRWLVSAPQLPAATDHRSGLDRGGDLLPVLPDALIGMYYTG